MDERGTARPMDASVRKRSGMGRWGNEAEEERTPVEDGWTHGTRAVVNAWRISRQCTYRLSSYQSSPRRIMHTPNRGLVITRNEAACVYSMQ